MVQRNLKTLQVRALLTTLVALLLFCNQFPFAQLLDRVVANVNGEPILESELRIGRLFYGIEERGKLLELLVRKRLITQFLLQNGLNIPHEYIDTVIKDMARANGKTLKELYEELEKEGITPRDLEDFIRMELISTYGLREFLAKRVEVSEIEIELERFKSGEVKYKKEIELIVVSKDRREELLEAINSYGLEFGQIAEALGVQPEKLKVVKGELVEPLDREVWKLKKGQVAVAEDQEHIYLAKVIRTIKEFSGRSEEEVRKEIMERKIREQEERLVEKLKKESLIEIFG